MRKGKKWIVIFIGAVILVLLLRGFLFTSYIIPSSGMENSLFQGDRILVNKWSYGLRLPLMSLFSYHRWQYKNPQSGDIIVFNNPASEEPAIDQRNIYIGRCIGIPGDTLLIDSLFATQSHREKAGPDRKRLYSYPLNKQHSTDSLLKALAITNSEIMGYNDSCLIRSFSHYESYLITQALTTDNWIHPLAKSSPEDAKSIIIPGKGSSIKVRPWNITLLRNTIRLHENKEALVKNDSLYIEGKAVDSYTFSKDYYWMASNNSVNFTDSRLFGFVPHDHLVGKATVVWFSKEGYSGLFQGYRWGRFFTRVK
ncbi:signal peptidase I [Bacteroides sp. 224]|uniref:signal peptidase I n=1 Tax=Bacteroides sp. 224 TaxID=2302936 RepID=UPI0013D113AD|nr:signal peptidase I [Bacteroides sp. 224]NDV65488.1 signal peptidase I [Bacteroides sp. 224]